MDVKLSRADSGHRMSWALTCLHGCERRTAAAAAADVSCHCITSATQGGGQIVEGEDVHALQHDLKADSQGRLVCSSPIAPEREKAEITDVTTCRNDMVTCESPLSVRFHELGPLPTPPNPPPNPCSHLSGPVCNRVMVIMFLCAWRLPSFRPRPCALRGSPNQNVAGPSLPSRLSLSCLSIILSTASAVILFCSGISSSHVAFVSRPGVPSIFFTRLCT